MVPVTIMRKKTLMNLLPFIMAIRAPNAPPAALQTAMGMAIAKRILPLPKKKMIEPRLVAIFTSLAFALAFKKSKPSKVMNVSTRKLPAPGPINPS